MLFDLFTITVMIDGLWSSVLRRGDEFEIGKSFKNRLDPLKISSRVEGNGVERNAKRHDGWVPASVLS